LPKLLSITVDRGALLKGCVAASRVITQKASVPVITCLRLWSDGEIVSVMGTDVEDWHEVSFPVNDLAAEAGMVALPSKMFVDVLSKLSTEKVTITAEGGGAARVVAGKSNNKVMGLTADDYPLMPAIAYASAFSLPAPVLSSALKEVAIAMSTDLTRMALAGMALQCDGANLRFIATDTHKLAARSVPVTNVAEFAVILPSEAVTHLLAVLPSSGSVDVQVAHDQAVFVWTVDGITTRYLSRLIDLQFANWQRVVPNNCTWSMQVERDTLRSEVALAGLFTDEKDRLTVTPGDQSVKLSTSSGRSGEGNSEVDCILTGTITAFALKSKQTEQVLAVMPTEGIRIEATTPLRPFVFRPIDYDHDVFWLLMPMQPE
jgi:DNA polymerase-3 subunit beta